MREDRFALKREDKKMRGIDELGNLKIEGMDSNFKYLIRQD